MPEQKEPYITHPASVSQATLDALRQIVQGMEATMLLLALQLANIGYWLEQERSNQVRFVARQ